MKTHQSKRRAVAKTIAVAALALSIPTAAEQFLRDSATLKNKQIVGQFVEFDQASENNDQMIVLSKELKLIVIDTASVITIVDGWVISDASVAS